MVPAAVFDQRGGLEEVEGGDVEGGPLRGLIAGPVVERVDAEALGQRVDAEGGAAEVAADDPEGVGVVVGEDLVGFPLAFEVFGAELRGGVVGGGGAEGGEADRRAVAGGGVDDLGCLAG